MWLREVLIAERLHWSYDEIQDAPEWWLERAELWFAERDAWVEAERKAAMHAK